MHFPSLGTCIFVPPHPADWDEAEQYCRSKGAHLVSITSEHEAFIVRDLVDKNNAKFFTWIGLSRGDDESSGDLESSGEGSGEFSGEGSGIEEENRDFTWSDGSKFDFNLFGPGEPSKHGDCVAWDRPNSIDIWHAINCDYAQFFLCKRNALNATTDYFEGPEGEIISPNHPKNYSDLQRRHYFIRVPDQERILLDIENFQTEKDRDTLTIYDGFSERAKTMRRLSGSISGLKMISSNNAVLLSFSSDEDTTDKGFRIKYRTWKYPDIIQIKAYGDSRDGHIESPNYPDPIGPLKFQHYLIQCPDSYHINFVIKDFSLQPEDRFAFHKVYDKKSRPILSNPNPSYLPYSFSTTTNISYFCLFVHFGRSQGEIQIGSQKKRIPFLKGLVDTLRQTDLRSLAQNEADFLVVEHAAFVGARHVD
ncbi:hypothetical protein WR25_06391 [Diploscapter pachys]|uniref:C-type lectin domain-containing protein n=1 Tax=Diploscapter pachys TaxID=2018661 RepID=A0A2A2LYU1_9BILA|nr:hypothetical protein WR25_06391 [Diploscapter pachys]